MSRELADHLKYYEEIGVTGVSRDTKWRKRAGEPARGGGETNDTERVTRVEHHSPPSRAIVSGI